MLSTKFRVNRHFGSGEESENRFQRSRPWRPSWNWDRNDLVIFIYMSSRCLLPSFRSTGCSIQEKKRKNIFYKVTAMAAILYFWSKWFSFLIYLSPWWFLPSFKSVGLLVQEKRKIDFKIAAMATVFDQIWIILAMLYLQVTQIYQPSFKSMGISVQEKKRKIFFSKWRPTWISYGTIVATFDLQVTRMLPTK